MTLISTPSHLALKKELRRLQSSTRASDLQLDAQTKSHKERLLGHLDCVSGLDAFMSDLSSQAAANAAYLVNHHSEIKKTHGDLAHNYSYHMEQCWNWVNQSIQLVQLHVKNAADYHKFHLSADDLILQLSHEALTPTVYPWVTAPRHEPLQEIPFITGHLQELHIVLGQLKERAELLATEARSVVPVHLRGAVGQLVSGRKAVWLCQYSGETDESLLSTQEEVTVCDTSGGGAVWTVETQKGKRFEVPAVGCLILGPDHAAIEKSRKLRDVIYKIWKENFEIMWIQVARMVQTLVQQINDKRLSVEPSLKHDFRQTLKEIYDLLTHPDLNLKETKRADWKRDMEACFAYLQGRVTLDRNRQADVGADVINQLRVLLNLTMLEAKQIGNLKHQTQTGKPPPEPTKKDSEKGSDDTDGGPQLVNNKWPQTEKPDSRISKLYCQVKPPPKKPGAPLHVAVTPAFARPIKIDVDMGEHKTFRSRHLVNLGNEPGAGGNQMTVRHFEVNKLSMPKICTSESQTDRVVTRTGDSYCNEKREEIKKIKPARIFSGQTESISTTTTLTQTEIDEEEPESDDPMVKPRRKAQVASSAHGSKHDDMMESQSSFTTSSKSIGVQNKKDDVKSKPQLVEGDSYYKTQVVSKQIDAHMETKTTEAQTDQEEKSKDFVDHSAAMLNNITQTEDDISRMLNSESCFAPRLESIGVQNAKLKKSVEGNSCYVTSQISKQISVHIGTTETETQTETPTTVEIKPSKSNISHANHISQCQGGLEITTRFVLDACQLKSFDVLAVSQSIDNDWDENC